MKSNDVNMLRETVTIIDTDQKIDHVLALTDAKRGPYRLDRSSAEVMFPNAVERRLRGTTMQHNGVVYDALTPLTTTDCVSVVLAVKYI